ncbi:hypothetical protein [Cupriavidus necator]|uniref:hypothetical protein n=1 Tax=Cupriavidus necator TaxID=106590 RepID=UPI00099388DF|nr:hypothetical protein [Cupriavidus necator]
MSAAAIQPVRPARPWLTASAQARQSLLAQVRRCTEQLRRRAERSGIFARVTPDGLARAELQRHLEEIGPQAGHDTACQCLVLLACAVDGGASISLDVFEKCRELADGSSDPALRALFFTCARRVVLGEPRLPADHARRVGVESP